MADQRVIDDRAAIKARVKEIFAQALQGRAERYRTETGHVRWERVKQDIYDVIDGKGTDS